MADIHPNSTYYESGVWPATEVKVISIGHRILVSAPDGTGARYTERQVLHATRVAADETTLAVKRSQLVNFETRAQELRDEVAYLESKKGQDS